MTEEFYRRYPRSQRSEKYHRHLSLDATLKNGVRHNTRRGARKRRRRR